MMAGSERVAVNAGRRRCALDQGIGGWGAACCWHCPLRAEVKVIPVFEADAAVQTLKEIYPDLGVSAMGNQLVLSGTPPSCRRPSVPWRK